MNTKKLLIPSFFAVAAIVGISLIAFNNAPETNNLEVEELQRQIQAMQEQKENEMAAKISKQTQKITQQSLAQMSGVLRAQMSPGETKSLDWQVGALAFDEPITLEIYATGTGSEYISMPPRITVNNELKLVPVLISLPHDISSQTLDLKLHAKKQGDTGQVSISLEAVKELQIIIS